MLQLAITRMLSTSTGCGNPRASVRLIGTVFSALMLLMVTVTAVAVAGCTTIHVINADVERVEHAGLVVLRVLPNQSGAAVIVTSGVGLTLGADNVTLGIINETRFTASDASACRAYFVPSDMADVGKLRAMLAAHPGFCLLATTQGDVQ